VVALVSWKKQKSLYPLFQTGGKSVSLAWCALFPLGDIVMSFPRLGELEASWENWNSYTVLLQGELGEITKWWEKSFPFVVGAMGHAGMTYSPFAKNNSGVLLLPEHLRKMNLLESPHFRRFVFHYSRVSALPSTLICVTHDAWTPTCAWVSSHNVCILAS